VSPGPDFDFATSGCGGAAGDDEAIPIATATYDGGTDTVALALASPLGAAQYRLFACDALADAAGNPLDGDGDTEGGGDFRRSFRADPGNLFENGHFDCASDGWTSGAVAPGEVSWTAAEDADDADDSGAVHFTNLAPGIDTSFSLRQCFALPGAAAFELEARVRLDAAPGVFVGFTRRCEAFDFPGCVGGLGPQSLTLLLSDTGGVWIPLAADVAAPPGAESARCDFIFSTGAGAAFDGYLDATRLVAGGAIFADGFESGDTSAWSGVGP
jgi:hypothetical protein